MCVRNFGVIYLCLSAIIIIVIMHYNRITLPLPSADVSEMEKSFNGLRKCDRSEHVAAAQDGWTRHVPTATAEKDKFPQTIFRPLVLWSHLWPHPYLSRFADAFSRFEGKLSCIIQSSVNDYMKWLSGTECCFSEKFYRKKTKGQNNNLHHRFWKCFLRFLGDLDRSDSVISLLMCTWCQDFY